MAPFLQGALSNFLSYSENQTSFGSPKAAKEKVENFQCWRKLVLINQSSYSFSSLYLPLLSVSLPTGRSVLQIHGVVI